MGCVNSKTDINDRHPNIFQVINVNEHGVSISPGKLQVTEMELVLYQRGKEPTKWPLRSLRKYGFDMDVFSFECGRRCPTGHGIYAFRCRRAEQLFNIVQQYITFNVNEENTTNLQTINNVEFPIPTVSTGPPVQRRVQRDSDGGYLNPQPQNSSIRSHPVLSRPGSMTSNDPTSPTTTTTTTRTSSSPPPETFEHNNNKRGSLVDRQYTNTSVLPFDTGLTNAGYVNMDTQTELQSCHVYMNIQTGKDTSLSPAEIEDARCYANIDVENLLPACNSTNNNEYCTSNSVPQTPTLLEQTDEAVREVNYVVLDLDVTKEPSTTADSPNREVKSYARIDFEKTNALSQSIQPRLETEEEGSRKTRHNSTINYNNNSLSD